MAPKRHALTSGVSQNNGESSSVAADISESRIVERSKVESPVFTSWSSWPMFDVRIGSKLKKNPQFVALKDKNLHFVIVRAISYPQDAHSYDPVFMQTIKEHATKFEAKTYYAGVGLGHGEDYSKPVIKDEPYSLLYKGIQEIL